MADKTCFKCKEPVGLPPKGTLFLDDATGVSYRVTDHWLHIGNMTPHTAVLQPQYPSGGGATSVDFLALVERAHPGLRLLWYPDAEANPPDDHGARPWEWDYERPVCEHDWPMEIHSGDACLLGCGATRA